MLITLPVFAFMPVFQHVQVRGIAAFADEMFLYGAAHGATRFMGVRAVVVFAVCRNPENFAEVVCHFFFFEVERAESFDARGVDDITAAGQTEHFAECRGVHARVVCGGYFCRPYVQVGYQRVQQSGLSYTGMAREQSGPAFQAVAQRVDTDGLQCGTGMAGIADGGVQVHHAFHVAEVVGIVTVGLVENERYRDAVRFGRSQETVDEGGGSFRMADGHD